MIYTRGNRRDFDRMAAAGNVGWNFENILPFYQKFERSVVEPIDDTDSFGKDGLLQIEEARFRLILVSISAVTVWIFKLFSPFEQNANCNGFRGIGHAPELFECELQQWRSNWRFLFALIDEKWMASNGSQGISVACSQSTEFAHIAALLGHSIAVQYERRSSESYSVRSQSARTYCEGAQGSDSGGWSIRKPKIAYAVGNWSRTTFK